MKNEPVIVFADASVDFQFFIQIYKYKYRCICSNRDRRGFCVEIQIIFGTVQTVFKAVEFFRNFELSRFGWSNNDYLYQGSARIPFLKKTDIFYLLQGHKLRQRKGVTIVQLPILSIFPERKMKKKKSRSNIWFPCTDRNKFAKIVNSMNSCSWDGVKVIQNMKIKKSSIYDFHSNPLNLQFSQIFSYSVDFGENAPAAGDAFHWNAFKFNLYFL